MFRELAYVAMAVWGLGLTGLGAPPAVTLQGSEDAQVLRFPHSADLWDAVLAADGRVHVVYSARAAGGTKRGASNLFYVATTDVSREEWSQPVAVPTGQRPATIGGERKACLAVMPDGALLVSWPSGGLIGAARSIDAGASWAEVSPRDPQAPGHADTMTMSDGRTGRVAVAWTDTAVTGRGDDSLAAPLHVALSTDGGATFAPAVAINENLLGACVCCTPDLAFDDSGALWVAYRTSESSVKEICVVRVGQDGSISGAIASRDDWRLDGCPMNGPELAVSGDGQKVSVTWTREDVIRCTMSTDAGRHFGEVFDLGAGRMHSGAAAGEALRVNWESGGGVVVADPAQLDQQHEVHVSVAATLLVAADGGTLLVTAAGAGQPPAGDTPDH